MGWVGRDLGHHLGAAPLPWAKTPSTERAARSPGQPGLAPLQDLPSCLSTGLSLNSGTQGFGAF